MEDGNGLAGDEFKLGDAHELAEAHAVVGDKLGVLPGNSEVGRVERVGDPEEESQAVWKGSAPRGTTPTTCRSGVRRSPATFAPAPACSSSFDSTPVVSDAIYAGAGPAGDDDGAAKITATSARRWEYLKGVT